MSLEREAQIEAALGEYLRRVDAGESIDDREFVARHPAIARQLVSCIETAATVERMAGHKPTQVDSRDTSVSLETLPADPTELRRIAPAIGLPRTFGRFEIHRELGQGAMGTVYLALDTRLQRQVALKFPKFSEHADPSLLERFYREARSAATLRHPNICPVYDADCVDGTHFIAMAYIQGRPLSAFIDRQSPPNPRMTALAVRKIARAVYEAHQHGIVHRDLKPSNILVDDRNEPIVMDFGLARVAGQSLGAPSAAGGSLAALADLEQTQQGEIIGTPRYMSPEQARGAIAEVGPASDIFSLGAIFYEMLTGKPPFEGQSLTELLSQVISVEPPLPAALRPEIDPGLEAICLRMLAKRPQDRYASMREVADAITESLQNSPQDSSLAASKQESVKPGGGKRKSAPKQTATNRRTWRLIAAGFLAVIALAAIVIHLKTRDGMLVVKVDQPDADVKVLSEEGAVEIVRRSDGGVLRIAISPGEHRLSVEKDGFRVFADEFDIAAGGSTYIHAYLEPLPVAAVASPAKSTQTPALNPGGLPKLNISSVGRPWLIQGEFEIQVHERPTEMEVRFLKSRLIRSKTAGTERVVSKEIVVGITDWSERWKFVAESEPYLINRALSPGEECQLGEFQLIIPCQAIADYSHKCLTVKFINECEERTNPRSYCYAHSEFLGRFLHGKAAASDVASVTGKPAASPATDAPAQGDRTFDAKISSTGWQEVQGEFEVQVQVGAPNVVVDFRKSRLIRSTGGLPHKLTVKGINIGVRNSSPPPFQWLAQSVPFPVDKTLEPGEEHKLEAFQLAIPRAKIPDFTNKLLTVSIEAERDGKRSYAFADSELLETYLRDRNIVIKQDDKPTPSAAEVYEIAQWLLQTGADLDITALNGSQSRIFPSGKLPTSEFKLKSISWRTKGTLPQFGATELARLARCNDVEKISFRDQSIQSLDWLTVFPRLSSLSIWGGSISAPALQAIGRLSNLRTLEFTAYPRGIASSALGFLRHLPNLEQVVFNAVPVKNEGIAYLAAAKNLKSLTLWGAGITDEGLVHLHDLERLEVLGLGSNSISAAGLRRLGELPALNELYLQSTTIDDAGLQELVQLPWLQHLTELAVDGTQITSKGVESLVAAKFLRRLGLSGTQVGDSAIPVLSQMVNLDELNVKDTRLSPRGVAELRHALPGRKIDHNSFLPLQWRVRYFTWPDAGPKQPPADWRAVVATTAVAEAEQTELRHDWQWASPQAKVPADHFALEATTEFDAGEGGFYALEVASDDGVRVFIDDELVIDAWTWRNRTSDRIERKLSSGRHALKVAYFDIEGWASLSVDLMPTIPMPDLAIGAFDAERAKKLQTDWARHMGVPVEFANSIGMKFVLIPPTSKTKPFYLGANEVTQGEYMTILGENPSHFSKTGEAAALVADVDQSRLPVDRVSLNHALRYCRLLSDRPAENAAARIYRLPTNEEWSLACLAGAAGLFHTGSAISSTQANFDGNKPVGGAPRGPFLERTTPVGSYACNAFGLFDMHGNVSEYCHNPSAPAGVRSALRGGSWAHSGDRLSVAVSFSFPENNLNKLDGFRVALEIASDER